MQQAASPTTLIQRADWMVAWDGSQHVYLKGADLAFDSTGITFMGHGYAGHADHVIDGRSRMVMPGFVNIHCHPTSEPLQRGLTEERKSRKLGMSTIYEYLQLVGRSNKTKTLADSVNSKDPQIYEDSNTRSAAAKVAFAELLQSGVTTVVDYSPNRVNWLDEVAEIGIRACIAPSFRSAGWYTTNGHEVLYRWDEEAGRQAFDEAMRVLDAVKQHPCDRLFGMMAPGQIDTCTEQLLRDAKAAARERDLPMTLHAAQSVVEFREMMRRHDRRRQCAQPPGSGPACARREGRRGDRRSRAPADDAGARSLAFPDLLGSGPRRARGLHRRRAGGSRGARAHDRSDAGAGTTHGGAAAHGSGGAPARSTPALVRRGRAVGTPPAVNKDRR